MLCVGVDFGTSNSSVAVYDGRRRSDRIMGWGI
jgi:molecular chaperone DnaK (HSP70)